MAARGTIDQMQARAAERGGKCLSKRYRNARAKLRWQCAEGHEFQLRPMDIVGRDQWCPECSDVIGKHTIGDIRKFARDRGGRCLSRSYVNKTVPLRWRCAAGHEWTTTFGTVRQGSWCPSCARERQAQPKRDLGDAVALAARFGGECLSEEVAVGKMRWRCQFGHEWESPMSDVLADRWCRTCARTRRHTIEDMRALAAERGGECAPKRYRDITTKLLWRCARGHRWKAAPRNVLQGTWCPRCVTREFRPALSLEDMVLMAENRGGRCLSEEHLGARVKLEWECALGHRWRAEPRSLRSSQRHLVPRLRRAREVHDREGEGVGRGAWGPLPVQELPEP